TTVVEIQQGIARLIRNGSNSRAAVIGGWLEDLLETTGSNTLPLSVEVARHAGHLSDFAYSIGRHPGLADVVIAATGQVHNLTLLTRNVRHFEPLGIDVIDPLVTLPG
ncbi:MAG TPA: VapC toxin family PIN domain ribonuclease, partial [Devosia sp.]